MIKPTIEHNVFQMMFPTDDTPTKRDDGFQFDPAAVERGMDAVERAIRVQESPGVPWRAIAAAIMLVVGLGLFIQLWQNPEPCISWACQLEELSDDELDGMLDLLDEEEATDLWSENDDWIGHF